VKEVYRLMRSTCRNTLKYKLLDRNELMVTRLHIHCDGDVFDGSPRYEAFPTPISWPTFYQDATDVSTLIGLPVVVWRDTTRNILRMCKRRTDIPDGMTPWKNTAATFLNVGCQPERDKDLPKYGWGVVSPEWQEYPGTVVVMRMDKKPLLLEHVAALSQFCGCYLASRFQAQMAPGSSLGKDHVLREITKEKFEEYFVKWRKVQTDPESIQYVSPYAI
jgi:hypothetical protein